ncbi:L,D-transpeptidase family protein [Leptospira wolffii]|uniref:L,D-transpeptidase family protein n=1 Tax=Leptospira wolffii TaxID=409998 RepID=UPI00058C8A11|nr:L,D-transpeptidase family protein [Leptospira wolffii]
MERLLALIILTASFSLSSKEITSVTVKKSERKLIVVQNGVNILELKISLGFNPDGNKLQEGDGRTPEGEYKLDYLINDWEYYKAFHISYPKVDQIKKAKENGVNPGGGILIHGMQTKWNWVGKLHTFWDWTHGCIAVTNEQMDKLIEIVPVGSKIIIEP